MLTRSTINPKSIWVKRIDKTSDGLVAIFRVRYNIHTVDAGTDDEIHTEYEYDEEELNCVLPLEVDSADRLVSYLKSNETKLVSQAKAVVPPVLDKPAIKPTDITAPWYIDVDNIRSSLSF